MSFWPFGGSTKQWTGQSGDLKVKTDVITGSAAADARTGTTIDGNNVSIVLATPKPENLSMRMPDGRTVEEATKQYIEQNPNTVNNHSQVFQEYIERAQQNYVQSQQGQTYATKGGGTKTYAGDTQLADKYSDLARLSGNPDFLPQTKQTLDIRSASTSGIQGSAPVERHDDVLDKAVNPYDNFYNLAGDKRRAYQQTIGGADLSIFFMAEYPNMEDVIAQVPPEAQRKELVIFELDSALSLSYSILRERFPVRTIGKSNAVAYTRGSRTIAGHIAFAVFAEDVLSRLRSRIRNKFDEIRAKFKRFPEGGGNINVEARAYDDMLDLEKMQYFYEAAFQYDKVQLLDSLPPFHLLIMGVNESGVWSKFIIKNVCIVDENQYQGTQQPNIVNKVSWVASDIIPMASFTQKSYTVVDSLNSTDESYNNGRLNLGSSFNHMTASNILDSVKEDLAKDTVNDPRENRLAKEAAWNKGA